MKIALVVFGALFLLIVLILAGIGLRWFGGAAKVAEQEFGARAMLEKYEWFKDAAAALDKKRADVAVYESRLKAIEALPNPTRADSEQRYVWLSEVAGIKASYNQLASEYNANMAKFNWAFAEAGKLPQGATTPLPREFKPYVEN